MQATFSWNGRPQQVGDIVAEMLTQCAPSLADLDARPTDLGVIGKMAEKRLCQADLALEIASRYEDPICLLSAYAKRLRNWNAFEEFLDASPALEPAEPLSRMEVLDEHVRAIGEGTSYYVSRSAMSYPPPQADAVLNELEASGRIVREITADGAIIVSRTSSI
jgi:hypothetical protein